MQIILLHPRFTQARSITLTLRHWLLALSLLLVLVLGSTAAMTWLTLTHAVGAHWSLVQNLLDTGSQGEAARNDRYMRENIAAMAIKLGEMQAQLMRLDALGERVQGLSGVKPEEFNFKELPGRGGATSARARVAPPLGVSQFQQALDALVVDIEHRSDYMNAVETTLMFDKIRSKLLPTIQPVNVSYNASGFGWRMDPFNGRSTFHEGIDFPAPTGTAIIAAAGGVVIAAEFHPQFGNMLEIDHGNDIVTRYAHASRLLMKVGDIVQRGQHVADIGTTGRSTGAHLHFEVLVKGVPQDPHKFLIAGSGQAAAVQVTRK
jgi:murein DD-endopeptidase MepM/ murein hydrolase activator NlpD